MNLGKQLEQSISKTLLKEKNKELINYLVPETTKEVAKSLAPLVSQVKTAVSKIKNGEKGITGDKGERGDKGDKGDTGEIGPIGPEGKQGEKGDKGDKGDQGIPGIDGKDGKTGKTGKTGKSGKDGEPGQKGDKGDDGKDGLDGSPDTPRDIKVKLESLTGDQRLDAGAIKNLQASFISMRRSAGSEPPSIGGELTGGTEGSVLFVGAGSVFAQDNANFFWDDTNNRLGIGTNSPSQTLHIKKPDAFNTQAIIIQSQSTTGGYGRFNIFNNIGGAAILSVALNLSANAAGATQRDDATKSGWGFTLDNRAAADQFRINYFDGTDYYPLQIFPSGRGRIGKTTDTSEPGAQLELPLSTATTKGILIKGAASQSANHFESQDSSGNVLDSFTASGRMSIKEAGLGILNAGQLSGNSTYFGLAVSQTNPAAISATNYWFLGNGTDTIFGRPTGGIIDFRENNVSQMSIAAGGVVKVGAGADSSAVGGTQLIVTNAGTTNLAIRDSTNDVELYAYAYSGGGIYGTYTNHDLVFRTNNTDRLLITAGGNFALNTTAPTMNTVSHLLLGAASWIAQDTVGGQTNIGNNFYYNSGFKYKIADEANGIEMANGNFRFLTAAAGSANGAISFTSRMLIAEGGVVAVNSDTTGTHQMWINGSLGVKTKDISGYTEALTVKQDAAMRLIATNSDDAFEFGIYNDGSENWALFQAYNRATATAVPTWLSASKFHFTGGNIGVGISAPTALIHADQSSTTGAKPVLTVDQADVSEEFIKFIGSSANGVLTQSIVEAADVGTATIAGYLKMFVQDDGNQLTDQAYYVPIYTLAA